MRSPSDTEITEARRRANVIRRSAWIVTLPSVAIAFITNDVWITALTGGAVVGCAALQHHAIKAARLLGPRDPHTRNWGPFWRMPGWVGIRWLGWQFDVSDHRINPPLFSERHGYSKRQRLHIGPFCFRGGRLRNPSTVPDHLPDNDESRGHGSVS